MIDIDTLLNKTQIGEALGISRERARQLALRPSFPEPVAKRGKELLWERQQILNWARENNRAIELTKVTKRYTPMKYIPYKQNEIIAPREYEILCLLAKGYTRSEIAKKLYITVGTVNVTTHHIAKKFNISLDKYLIDKAIELNLISVDRNYD